MHFAVTWNKGSQYFRLNLRNKNRLESILIKVPDKVRNAYNRTPERDSSVYKKNFYKMFYSMAGRYSLCTDYKKYLPDSNTRASARVRASARSGSGGKQLPLLFD